MDTKEKKNVCIGEGLSEKTHSAEPGATANEPTCHGSCSEQHAPRQAGSSLSFNVRQKYYDKLT